MRPTSPRWFHPYPSTALLTLALCAAPAGAVPYSALFNGPVSGPSNIGVSAGSASAAQAAGVPIVTPPVFSAAGVLDVVDQDLDSITIDPDDLDAPFEIDSTWTIENIFGSDLNGQLYLLFVAVDPRTIQIGGQTEIVDHIDSQTGLVIDGATGWVIVQTVDPVLGTLYYPAISLGSLSDGQQKDIVLRYVLNDLINFPDGPETIVPLPQLRLGMAFIVPEPATGLLVVLGLVGLAARARQRS